MIPYLLSTELLCAPRRDRGLEAGGYIRYLGLTWQHNAVTRGHKRDLTNGCMDGWMLYPMSTIAVGEMGRFDGISDRFIGE